MTKTVVKVFKSYVCFSLLYTFILLQKKRMPGKLNTQQKSRRNGANKAGSTQMKQGTYAD